MGNLIDTEGLDQYTDEITTFTSGDSSSPSSFTTIPVVASKEKPSSLFQKLSQAISNIRWLKNNMASVEWKPVSNSRFGLETDITYPSEAKELMLSIEPTPGYSKGWKGRYITIIPTNDIYDTVGGYSYHRFFFCPSIYSSNRIGFVSLAMILKINSHKFFVCSWSNPDVEDSFESYGYGLNISGGGSNYSRTEFTNLFGSNCFKLFYR